MAGEGVRQSKLCDAAAGRKGEGVKEEFEGNVVVLQSVVKRETDLPLRTYHVLYSYWSGREKQPHAQTDQNERMIWIYC